MLRKIIIAFFVLLINNSLFSQKDSEIIVQKQYQFNSKNKYNPLSPSKAAFYSAIFPGGGQIYNKKYWKAPIVWAAIGTSIYFYIHNADDFDRYRRAFKLRKQGIRDEFMLDDGTYSISTAGLERAQKVLQKNKDLSLLTGILLYVLQIVEASVNAHLMQFDTDDGLSINPTITPDPMFYEAPKVGLTLKYAF